MNDEELTRQVAEKVMDAVHTVCSQCGGYGFMWINFGRTKIQCDKCKGAPSTINQSKDYPFIGSKNDDESLNIEVIRIGDKQIDFKPLTDPSHLQLVEDEMVKNGWLPRYALMCGDPNFDEVVNANYGEWVVEFRRGAVIGNQINKSKPHAFLRAALLSVEVKGE